MQCSQTRNVGFCLLSWHSVTGSACLPVLPVSFIHLWGWATVALSGLLCGCYEGERLLFLWQQKENLSTSTLMHVGSMVRLRLPCVLHPCGMLTASGPHLTRASPASPPLGATLSLWTAAKWTGVSCQEPFLSWLHLLKTVFEDWRLLLLLLLCVASGSAVTLSADEVDLECRIFTTCRFSQGQRSSAMLKYPVMLALRHFNVLRVKE